MRRKSTRAAAKKAPPEKTPVKRTRRQSRRNKRASSVSSEGSDDEPLKNLQNTESTADETQSTITDADSDDDSVPLAELEVRRGRRQTKVAALIEESTNSRPRRGRSSQASPVAKDIVQQEDDNNEDIEDVKGERKGKGKSKSKNKSKTEQASSVVEPENQPNHDVSENVQVTTQSPNNNDKPVENFETVQNVSQCENNDTNIIVSRDNNEENDVQNTENCSKIVYNQDTVIGENENSQTEPEQMQIDENESKNSADDSNTVSDIVSQPSVNDNYTNQQENNSKHIPERSFIENEIADSPKDYEKDDSNIEEKSNEDVDSQSETNTVPETENVEEKHETVKTVNESVQISTIPETSERKQRISSISISVEEDKEVVKPKSSKKIKLNRNFSTETKETEPKPIEKKLKWDDKILLENITAVQKVDVVSLKTVCPTLEFLNENEVKLDDVPKERKKSTTDAEVRLNRLSSTENDDNERMEIDKSTLNSSTEHIEREDTTNIIAINRKISIVDDTASKLRPPPSPAKNPVSDVLFITNLVRPFTIKQLKELLQRTGNIKEEGFWTDRIKSKCYVQYESQEEAEATRNALHGVNWPIGNGKKLMIEYATTEDIETAKNPPPPPPPAPAPATPEKIAEKENKEPERRVSESDHKEVSEKDEKRKRSDGHVREWDVGKEDLYRRRSRSRERGRKNRRSTSPRDDFFSKKQRKEEDAVPQKLMDDLFLKTKATPSIYWQPLSPEEIATKQQQRLIRMEEHKRRMEESSRVRDRNRRGGSFRRR